MMSIIHKNTVTEALHVLTMGALTQSQLYGRKTTKAGHVWHVLSSECFDHVVALQVVA